MPENEIKQIKEKLSDLEARIAVLEEQVPEKVKINICAESRLLPTQWCPEKIEVEFEKGQEPSGKCDVHQRVKLKACSDSRLRPTRWCPEAKVFEFLKSERPTERCDIHKKPIMVKLKVCDTSQLLPNEWCPKVTIQKFEEGKEPTSDCTAHTELAFEKKIEDMHFGGLGYWLWFMMEAWKPSNRQRLENELQKTMAKIREKRFSVVDFFLWICDGTKANAHFNKKIPWMIKDNLVDFDEWNPKWWDLFDTFLRVMKHVDLEPCVGLFLTKYNEWAFRHNVNNVRTFFNDEKAFKYQVAFTRRVIRKIQDIYGQNYVPWLKANNELMHHGKDEWGHIYADWYLDLWEAISDLFPDNTDVSRWVCDATFSEFVLAPFVEPIKCPKCDRIFGDKKFLRNNYRMVVPENHGYSIKKNFVEGGFQHWLGSNWKKTPHRWHEDGGGGEEAKGYKVGGFIIGTAAQTYEMAKYMWTESKRRRKRSVFALFPLEYLKQNEEKKVWIEDCRVDSIDWARADSLIKAHRDVYGHS